VLGQLIGSGIATGCVYALVALGLTILYRATTVVNFGHGEFFMLGAFTVYTLERALHVPPLLGLLVSFALLFVIGMVVEAGLMRRLRDAPHISLAMMTVALSFLFKGVARFFAGRDVSPLPPLVDGDPIEIAGAVFLPQDLLVVAATIVVVIGFFVFFQYTQLGKVIQAASRSPRGAALSGLNVPLFQSTMWGVSAVMGALAGVLIAPSTLVYPDMGSTMLIRAFAAMTLGGFGSLPGAVAGGLTMGVLENLTGGYVSSSAVDITSFLVIILVLLLRPQGLLGEGRTAHV